MYCFRVSRGVTHSYTFHTGKSLLFIFRVRGRSAKRLTLYGSQVGKSLTNNVTTDSPRLDLRAGTAPHTALHGYARVAVFTYV